MTEPVTQRVRETFDVKSYTSPRVFIGCTPLETPDREHAPVLSSGLFAFDLKEGVTVEQAVQLARLMDETLSILMYTPL